MILTSTRAIPNSHSDILSDYDVILALTDVRPFAESRQWLSAFGAVLVMYQDPLESDGGLLHSGNVVQFESGLKIDFTLVETQHIASLASSLQLPTEYDAGYRVLLDKDNLTAGLKPPTYRAYIPSPPSETLYRDMVEGALLDATYVAKYLRRGDRMAAWHVMTTYLKDEHLRPLLEWHYELDHNWTVKPGPYGRAMQKWLRPDLRADLENTYAGHGLEEAWDSLFRTLALLRKVAQEVGDRLGYPFPAEMMDKATDYIRQIKEITDL
jgi:aminoglycoside 6-adenylyltransferase